MKRTLPALVVLVAALVAAQAHADTGVLPQGLGLPWTDPAHQSPLEQLATQIASHIAGRPVGVRCEGQTDWDTLTEQRGIPATEVGGYVDLSGLHYYASSGTLVDSAELTELAPGVCLSLQTFAQANPKPTKCRSSRTQTETVFRTVRYRAKVRVRVQKRVRVKGRWVTRKVWVTRTVTRTKQVPKTVTTTVQGPLGPCYHGGAAAPAGEAAGYWASYWGAAQAILTLAHESIHLLEFHAGVPLEPTLAGSETHAECYGLQWIPYVAEQLGATPDDAQAIAAYAYDNIYPRYQGVANDGSPYWSADCVPGGSLDVRPAGSTAWP